MGERIDEVKGGLEELLNRKNGGVQLRGTVEQLSLLGVSMRSGSYIFTAFLDARGKLSAEIDAAGG